MKRACLVTLVCWLLPAAAFATPCIPGSLASYVALGGGGCSIGTAQFFNFVELPLLGGATPIPDSVTLVNPLGPSQPGFRFDVNSLAGSGDLFERVIGYSVSGPGFTNDELFLTGNNVTADGAITALEHTCLGAAFGAGLFCSGVDSSLGAFDLGFLGQTPDDSSSFPSIALIGVVLDLTVDGGGSIGAAGLNSVTTEFTPVAAPVPEPSTLALLGVGLAVGIGGRRFRSRKPPQSSVSTADATCEPIKVKLLVRAVPDRE